MTAEAGGDRDFIINLGSDNVAGCAPEILAALGSVADAVMPAYGEDSLTLRLVERLAEVFEKPELIALPVISGTAANAIALATMTPPWGAVFCHEASHLYEDECGAPEWMTGGAKLVGVQGEGCIMDPDALVAAVRRTGQRGVHSVEPKAVSITNLSELGRAMTSESVAAFSEIARAHGLTLHMDGARFSNACAATGSSPADLTWRAGVDILSLGATKNGALAAEVLIFFDPTLAESAPRLRKRAGHLISKMRFVSAQLEAWLEDDRWLHWASHANAMAQRLVEGIAQVEGIRLASPADGNEVFLEVDLALAKRASEAGLGFVPWGSPVGQKLLIRLACAFNTQAEQVDSAIQLLRDAAAKA